MLKLPSPNQHTHNTHTNANANTHLFVRRYAAIKFTSSLITMQPLAIKRGVTEYVDKYLEETKAASTAMPGSSSLKLTGDRYWVWSATEQGLIDGMFLGLSICFPVA